MFDRLLTIPDGWLNRISMYRLVIYYLVVLIELAIVLSWLGDLAFPIRAIVASAALSVVVCVAVNRLFAVTFGAPKNDDSAIITGLILALVIDPAQSRGEYVFIAWAATLAMASKYILAYRKLHLVNPAAIAVVITATFSNETASWWVATSKLTPFVIAGGLLLTRKIRRGDLVVSFLWATFFLTLAYSALDGKTFTQGLTHGVLDSPAWFLAFVMLTEPVTTPATQPRQLLYGVLAGILVFPQLHLGAHYLTPELGLVIANLLALPLRSRRKLLLHLDRAVAVGPGLVDFFYLPTSRLAYTPGQYMEWTLEHDRADDRGKRRYFTLASSPTERALRVGVKFVEAGSSYKAAMLAHAGSGDTIVASQVAGDFTLPRDRRRKLAFIAGGIGVTPFRSMVKYVTDRGEQRDIVLLYANRHADEILYRDVFGAARRAFGFRPVYVLSEPDAFPGEWKGECGRIDAAMIARQIPDYRERLFYVSGSPALVHSVLAALHTLGVKPSHIKTDHFSGLAA